MIKTVGHSSHPIERFVDLLKKGGVEELVDVRSVPYSRRFPHFGRERLEKSLADAGIAYRWQGDALGGKGCGSYEEAAARTAFKGAIASLIERSRERTLALMCAEKEPLDCHRTVLVSRRLAERGAEIVHLLADGGSRTHAAIEDALIGATDEPDLFLENEDRAARLADAWRARERRMTGGT